MVTRFQVTEDNTSYVFTAKKPSFNAPYAFYCNGKAIEEHRYNQWLAHFKSKRAASKATAPF